MGGKREKQAHTLPAFNLESNFSRNLQIYNMFKESLDNCQKLLHTPDTKLDI